TDVSSGFKWNAPRIVLWGQGHISATRSTLEVARMPISAGDFWDRVMWHGSFAVALCRYLRRRLSLCSGHQKRAQSVVWLSPCDAWLRGHASAFADAAVPADEAPAVDAIHPALPWLAAGKGG